MIQAGQAQVWDGSQWIPAKLPIGAAGTPIAHPLLATAVVGIARPGTAHTKSAWTEIIGSAQGGNVFGLIPTVDVSGQDTATLIDIAKGSAGSEVILAENIPIGSYRSENVTNPGAQHVVVPVNLTPGDRISARIQSIRTSGTVSIGARKEANLIDFTANSAVDVYGGNTATSAGIAMSASANVYVEVTGSATREYYAMMPLVSCSSGTQQVSTFKVTYATGAAGSEVDIFDYWKQSNSGEQIFNAQNTTANPPLNFQPLTQSFSGVAITYAMPNEIFKIRIPQGTRISAKIDTASRSYVDAAFMGLY